MKTLKTVRLTADQAQAWKPTKRQQRLQAQRASKARLSREAATAPLPGPLREAFAAPPRQLMGLELQPVTATHVAALVEIQNPFVDGIRFGLLAASAKTAKEKAAYAKKAEAVKNTIEDAIEVLLLFTSTPECIRARLRDGRQAIRETTRALMDTLTPVPLEWLASALADHYMRSFATCIQHQAKEEKPGVINFQMPARSKTDLAGSSTRSAL
jgi:hypothetical protein